MSRNYIEGRLTDGELGLNDTGRIIERVGWLRGVVAAINGGASTPLTVVESLTTLEDELTDALTPRYTLGDDEALRRSAHGNLPSDLVPPALDALGRIRGLRDMGILPPVEPVLKD